jgi:hypothetical protein
LVLSAACRSVFTSGEAEIHLSFSICHLPFAIWAKPKSLNSSRIKMTNEKWQMENDK